ncbi:hypothetical protein FQN49_007003, partial [Arthroderma sp. PD_2]
MEDLMALRAYLVVAYAGLTGPKGVPRMAYAGLNGHKGVPGYSSPPYPYHESFHHRPFADAR